ncbi:MAG: exopolyphosphatase [Spirochaetaceae bacterium]|nr:MAG: exopolyphosphatase [Spirochaetaceae bacterium]
MGDEKPVKYRLLTRSDFDGLVCSVLLRERDLVDEIKFVHPKDMQDGLIPVTDRDVTANLPYVPGVHLSFDHHASETDRLDKSEKSVIDKEAPSAARVIFEYFGGEDAFPSTFGEMMEAVDKGDSASFELDEVLNPERWNLLNFITDARTGLGRFKNFRISNYQLMMDLIDYCRTLPIEEILRIFDVKERIELYKKHEKMYKKQIKACSMVEKNVLITDLRKEDTIYAGNRFIKYALYPDTNISVQIMWGFKKQNTVITVGKSIFNRTSDVEVGSLMLEHGGGGHSGAGTCQVETSAADRILAEIVTAVRE